ncbi:MAG: ATPase, T2SS/T4P/T4SS family [Acidimicrobiia bacterium]
MPRGLGHTLHRGPTAKGNPGCDAALDSTFGARGMTADAYDVIRREVLAQVERRRLRPEGDLDEVKVEVLRAVDEYQRRARLGETLPLATPATMVDRILRSITDLGPLTDLVARRDVEEIFIEGARVSYLDAGGRLRGLTEPTSEEENRQLLDRLLGATERQLNTRHPMVQARVLDGTARLTAAIPPIGDALSATLRRYVVRNVSLDDLVARDSLTAEAAEFLRTLMQLRSRITVSGEPGAGKTTLAAALLAAAPPSHCVRSCEEIRELAVPITHGSYYEVRPPSIDGTGEISMRDLVKFVLAMRPDRIVVGEVRGAEAFELSRAVNAGCGFLCTVHANSAAEALDALVNAALMAGENVTERIVRKVFSESLDLVIHVDRDDVVGDTTSIRRQVVEIAAVVPALRDDFSIEPLFTRAHVGAPLEWTGAMPARLERRLARVATGSGSPRQSGTSSGGGE